ncbi:head maturation protease, ClpP-related [Mycolicibacterium komossense]|uniref:ATP-dependent Clp protease proteolytic subunit n=1 Tax=Mycolicibacterium komossense TaxID=1779 RepID=A0ABT3CMI9_9MYCO|nr:head maturation protease, ClpP-related [Mycolicibacterium komossense]MCV7230675.1 Clp protease ClpP [Mycolicibacterium komossense]
MNLDRDRQIALSGLTHFLQLPTFNAAPPVMRLNESQRRSARAALGIAADADPIEWFRIQKPTTVNAAGKTKTSAEILIYDIIDPWGVSAGDFANALNELEVDEIVVGINSPGGIVFDGIAIMNALKRHPANIITRIDGMAASAASFIAMAGDEIQTSKYAEMMIHEAWGYVSGNASDMQEMHDLLIRHNESIASVYADRAGGSVKDWLKLMKNETWFTAEEMITNGLADTIIEPADDSSEADETESLKNRFDLTVFNYAGRSEAPPPAIRIRNQAVPADRSTKGAPVATLKEQLAEKHGLDVELDDDAFAAALEAALATEEESPADPAGEPDPVEAGELAAASATLKKFGFAVVDTETLEAVKAQSQRGSEAFAAIQAQADAQMLDDAIRTGKIAPASRAKWEKNLTGAARAEYIEALKNAEAVFPVQEQGHGQNPDPGAEMSAPDGLGWFDSAPLEPSTK